jgi:hypothetical protein
MMVILRELIPVAIGGYIQTDIHADLRGSAEKP